MDSIYIGDFEYYAYKSDKCITLVSNKDNIYNGRILEIRLLENDEFKMRLKDFNKGVLEDIFYVQRFSNKTAKVKYFCKKKCGLMVDDFEQPPIFNINMEAFYDINKEVKNVKLNLRRDGKKTIKMQLLDNRYNFKDIYDDDRFHITSTGIATFIHENRCLPRSLDRLVEFAKRY